MYIFSFISFYLLLFPVLFYMILFNNVNIYDKVSDLALTFYSRHESGERNIFTMSAITGCVYIWMCMRESVCVCE